MKRQLLLFTLPLLIATPALGGTAMAAPSVELPPGYEIFTPNVDYESLMSGVATGTGALSCIIESSNIAAFPPGDPFDPAALQADPTKGFRFVTALNDPTKEALAVCKTNVSIPTGLRSMSSPVTNAALVPLVGTDTGTFGLDCELAGNIVATSHVRFGGKVPGKMDVLVQGADKPIPFNCALAITFGTSTLNGTVSGDLKLISPAESGLCDGLSTITCAPIRLTDAKVVITSSTGGFGGLTGEGTHSFTNSFKLPFVEKNLTSIPYFTVTASGVRKTAVRAVSGKSETIRLSLTKKASKTAILQPIGSTLAAGGKIIVAGTAKASCTLTAKYKNKTVRLGSFKLDQAGKTPARTFSAKAAKTIGAKVKGTVSVTASCRGVDKKMSDVTKKLTYLG